MMRHYLTKLYWSLISNFIPEPMLDTVRKVSCMKYDDIVMLSVIVIFEEKCQTFLQQAQRISAVCAMPDLTKIYDCAGRTRHAHLAFTWLVRRDAKAIEYNYTPGTRYHSIK